MEAHDVDLDAAIAAVYGGPLEEFVQRRDALAKMLRAAGRRDDASAVKALRKPSRTAWVLDRAVQEHPDASRAIERAVAATLDAQASGGDIRGAIAALRDAVRELAGHAARAADEAGHRLDTAGLTHAVHAVLGRADAFNALRGGRLADVPDAGGLDFLAGLPAPEIQLRPARPAPAPPPARAPEPPSPPAPDPRIELERALRAELRDAEAELAAIRKDEEATRRALEQAEAEAAAAEAAVREAESALHARRLERDRAREAVERTSILRQQAEDAVADAEARLSALPKVES